LLILLLCVIQGDGSVQKKLLEKLKLQN